MSDIQPVHTSSAPEAIGPYSQAVRMGQLLFTAGQIALDPATMTVQREDIEGQTARVMENLKAILEAGGSGLDRVVKTTVYLADMGEFAAMNQVYARYFGDHRPARSAVEVARLPRDVRVEIEAVAVIG